ncbi:AraC family transcriptional regulator [Niastella yeongjuensis]|uniref:AraC family transcriptional regulator n=1 Tax=Niastella yeongjuensis TaxID=354355 RepID=A0A1V9F8J2_9BACT|nr:helix-turn-helix domain-containing protein [Niastella yeongjuensis]OQP54684.1 AraC family transcriptional regulator [Niastella yeongjuensis]
MKPIPIRHIASSIPENQNGGRFTIRSIEQVLKGEDLVHDLHKHDFFFVLALQSGKGMHEIDFIPYPLHDHAIFILRPGQVHKLELQAASSGFLMEFDLTFYQPKNSISEHRWKKASGKNYCEVAAARYTRLHALLENIFNEFDKKMEGYAEVIKATLDIFFIEYIRQSLNPNHVPKPETIYNQECFEAFAYLLETNISSLKKVSQYADLLHLSPYQLNAITKESVGKTVSDLINEQIILEAKRYLLATPNQIKDIADLLGYEDISYFIRFFKKQTGQTPEAFRKNFK